MNIIEHLMDYYNKGIEELMGAKEYADKYEKAESAEDKAMYRSMARQEIEHACNLMKAGDRLFSGPDAHDSLQMVWHHLKKHLHDWRASLETRLADK